MSTGTALSAKISPQDIEAINGAAKECRTALQSLGSDDVAGSLVVAESMAKLRASLTPAVMASVAALQGTAIGFKTDQDAKGGYPAEQLRDPVIEAAIRGFRLVGNEFNVIAGRFYGCKAGFERLVKTWPGLGQFTDAYDVVETIGGNAKVQCIATFTLDGQPQRFARQKENTPSGTFDNRISVRVNSGMGVDAIEGKARRKFYAWLYDRLCGNLSSTPEGEIGEEAEGTAKKELVPMFSGGAVKEDKPIEDDGCPLIVAEYRSRFAAVSERTEIGKTMAMAGRDSRLTPKGRKAIADLANEAQRSWPKRLDATGDGAGPADTPGAVADATAPPPEPASETEPSKEAAIAEAAAAKAERVYLDRVAKADTLVKVLDAETLAAGDPDVTEPVLRKIMAACAAQREKIKSTRGARTNGGKGQLFDKGQPSATEAGM